EGAFRTQQPGATWRWVSARLLPAASLIMLMVWQLTALLADSRTALTHVSWLVVAGFARAILYAAFLSILVVAVLLREQPFDRDGRLLIRGAAVMASFLLVLLGQLAPAGPLLLRVPPLMAGAAAVLTLGGVLLALAAAFELGTNFSFGPQSRQLVSTGPYRLVRHPMYLAELLMTTGIVMVAMHLTVVIGLCAVIVLQVVRISAEEELLIRTMPTYRTFVRATRCRLIPSVW
ncbi:MAG: isoprenylcysteine carboxylmethyltransferase family protein, partial [Acidimicrobiales bacterium]